MRLRDRRRLGKCRARVWAANRKLLQRYKGSHIRWSDWSFREYLDRVMGQPGGSCRVSFDGDFISDATATSSLYCVVDMFGKILLEE